MTILEFEALTGDDTVKFELDEGVLILTHLASLRHGQCEGRILACLGRFAGQHGLGAVYPGDSGFRISPGTVRAPDVSFVQTSRLPEVQQEGYGNGAPDLAVEVFSPSDSVPQLMRKIRQYFEGGTKVVWVAYPEKMEIHVIEASGADRILGATDTLDCTELLPGFSVPVESLFT